MTIKEKVFNKVFNQWVHDLETHIVKYGNFKGDVAKITYEDILPEDFKDLMDRQHEIIREIASIVLEMKNLNDAKS